MPAPKLHGRPQQLHHELLGDPLQRYSVPLFNGFSQYLKWYVRRHFHAVRVASAGMPCVPQGSPLIICSNHPSWWDPLLFALVGRALFAGRRGYGPMEIQALKRYPILERLGVFGVELESAQGGVAFMIQAKRILTDPASILWLTVQGSFSDVRRRPVAIQPGIGYLVRMMPGVVVLPMAVEYPFWNESRPEALCRFGAAIQTDGCGAQPRTAIEWTCLFEAALSRTMDELAVDSQQRSPAPFQPLLAGTAGVGGIYDVWRRLRAWKHRGRFDASHERPE